MGATTAERILRLLVTLRTLRKLPISNPELASRLDLPVDSVRRSTRSLVVGGKLMIVRYRKPQTYTLRRKR